VFFLKCDLANIVGMTAAHFIGQQPSLLVAAA